MLNRSSAGAGSGLIESKIGGMSMATKLEFYLSDDDAERLFAAKEDAGKDDLTGNEFARELLEKELRRIHPQRVRYDDETGKRIKNR